MNKEEIIKYCLTLENTYKDCPFPDDFESVTMKHCKDKKWFTFINNANHFLFLECFIVTDSKSFGNGQFLYVSSIPLFLIIITLL